MVPVTLQSALGPCPETKTAGSGTSSSCQRGLGGTSQAGSKDRGADWSAREGSLRPVCRRTGVPVHTQGCFLWQGLGRVLWGLQPHPGPNTPQCRCHPPPTTENVSRRHQLWARGGVIPSRGPRPRMIEPRPGTFPMLGARQGKATKPQWTAQDLDVAGVLSSVCAETTRSPRGRAARLAVLPGPTSAPTGRCELSGRRPPPEAPVAWPA